MKAKMKLKLLAAALGAATVAQAADLTWDAGTDMNWDTSTANWTGSTWKTLDNAIFDGTGVGTVTLTEMITAGNITFNAAGYTIDTNGNPLIASGIKGTEDYTKSGAGNLTLTGTSDSTGKLTISAGSVTMAESANFSGTTGDIDIASGGSMLWKVGTLGRTLARNITGSGVLEVGYTEATGIGSLNAQGKLSDFNGTLQIGRISGSGTGFARVQVNGLGSGANVVVTDGGQFFNVAATTYSNDFNIQGVGGAEGLGAIRVSGGDTYSGTITVNSAARIGGFASSVADFSGKITGGDLTLGGGNYDAVYKLTNNNNDYQSTVFQRGTLLAGGDSVFGAGSFTHNGGELSSDSTTPRTFANDYVIGGDVTLGNTTNNGKLTFTGDTHVTGVRQVTTNSKVEFAGVADSSPSGKIAHYGPGELILSGGGTLAGNQGAHQTGGAGALTLAGTWTNTGLWTQGGAGDAVINIVGDVTSNKAIIIGQNTADHTGILNITGTYTQSNGNISLGNNVASATGIINLEDGGLLRFDSTGEFVLGRDTGVGILNLNGGTVETGAPIRDSNNKNSGNANVNFDGGTLKATASIPDILQKNQTGTIYNVTVKDGGAIVDTNGFDVGISRNLTKDSGSTGGLTKNGAGTLTLTGTNNYDGATNIAAGVLIVNGAHTGYGDVSVSSGATLGGTGSLAGDITVGGFLAAGGVANDIGALKTGSLNFAAGSTFAYEFRSDAAFNGDLIAAVGGTLNIAFGAILDLSDLFAGALNVGDKLTLISYDGQWNGGLFTYNGSDLADGGTFTIGANDWLFRYDDDFKGDNFADDQFGASKFVTMTVIPEPGAALLAALGGVFLIRRRRNSAVQPPRGEAAAMPGSN